MQLFQFANIELLTQQGGNVLWVIFAIALIIFVLFFERLLYLSISFPKQVTQWQKAWGILLNNPHWEAHRIREAMLAQGEVQLNRARWLLKVSIMVCPLLGLIGTVSGMILVFDNLAFAGTGNPRLMSSGIFQATIPTMAGMLIAIVGMILQQIVIRVTRKRKHLLEQALKTVG